MVLYLQKYNLLSKNYVSFCFLLELYRSQQPYFLNSVVNRLTQS